MSIVQENSRQLQTILDTRETMLDIATVIQKSGSKNVIIQALRRDNYTNEELFGGEGITSSFLRYQSPLRNCFKKGIDLSNCICKMKMRTISVWVITVLGLGVMSMTTVSVFF